MKKILSIALALVLCLALTATAFAGTSSPSPSPSPEPDPIIIPDYDYYEEAKDANGNEAKIAKRSLTSGNELLVAYSNAATTAKFVEATGLTDKVNEAVKSYGLTAADLKVVNTYDVYVAQGKPEFPVTVKIAVAGVKTTDAVVIIHKASTGYEIVKATVVADGQVEAVFNSLSPIAILVADQKYTSYADCTKGAACLLSSFTDLKTTEWYHDGVHYCIDKEYMVGSDNGLWYPTDTITREEVATILWSMAGKKYVNYAMQFTDVPAGAWYEEAVRWAASEGIVAGISTTEFGAGQNITREELATMLYAYEQKVNDGGFKGAWMFLLTGFEDVDKISSWADTPMKWMTMKKVMVGADGYLYPTDTATRAEVATMIKAFCTVER